MENVQLPTTNEAAPVPRRSFLSASGAGILSAGTVMLLAGCASGMAAKPASADSAEADAGILNTALGAEQEAIAAYQVGAESGLLTGDTLALAVGFQDHHKQHAELLSNAVKQLGGAPAVPKASYDFPTDELKSQEDVLRFAAQLEKGAVSAYLGAVPLFGDRDLAKAAASILGDEAMHWAVLRSALGLDPVPVAFVS